MKILGVTGASGFLGGRFLRIFSERHPEVRVKVVFRKSLPAFRPANSEFVCASLEDKAALGGALRDCDTAVHFAAATRAEDEREYFSVNAEGTKNLAEAAKSAGTKRLIFISSRAIEPACGVYARSKKMAEEFVERSGIDYVILRFSEVYGTASSEGVGGLINFVRRLPLVPYPAGKITLSPLFIDDAAKGIISVLERPHLKNRIYTLAGPHSYEFAEAVRIIASAFSLKRLIFPLPIAVFRAAAFAGGAFGLRVLKPDQIDRMICEKSDDISEARRDFGFDPRPFEERIIGSLTSNKPPTNLNNSGIIQ